METTGTVRARTIDRVSVQLHIPKGTYLAVRIMRLQTLTLEVQEQNNKQTTKAESMLDLDKSEMRDHDGRCVQLTSFEKFAFTLRWNITANTCNRTKNNFWEFIGLLVKSKKTLAKMVQTRKFFQKNVLKF